MINTEAVRQRYMRTRNAEKPLTAFIRELVNYIESETPETRTFSHKDFDSEMRYVYRKAVNEGIGEVNYRKRVESLVNKYMREPYSYKIDPKKQNNPNQQSLI